MIARTEAGRTWEVGSAATRPHHRPSFPPSETWPISSESKTIGLGISGFVSSMSVRAEPELVALRKLAEELASRRKERVTSAHLLAAIAARPSVAQDLLAARKLNEEALLRPAPAATDDLDPA